MVSTRGEGLTFTRIRMVSDARRNCSGSIYFVSTRGEGILSALDIALGLGHTRIRMESDVRRVIALGHTFVFGHPWFRTELETRGGAHNGVGIMRP